MKNYFRILVATDYSSAGDSAMQYAINFAKSTNAVLTFLHVFEKSPEYSKEFSMLEHIDNSPIEFETRKLEQHVEEIFDRCNYHPAKSDYQCTIRQGRISKEICTEAKAAQADFIVLGTHTVSGFNQVFGESHTWEVINKACIPVLAIPCEASFNGLHNLIFATEYRKGELPVIAFLTKFAEFFDANLTVLHIASDVLSDEFEKEMFDKFAREVKAKIPYDKINIRLMHSDKLYDGLNDFCVSMQSSWLAMSPEKSLTLEWLLNPIASKTKGMAFHTHVPLFAIPDSKYHGNKEFWKMVENQYNIDQQTLLK